jgi:hypothetical protein
LLCADALVAESASPAHTAMGSIHFCEKLRLSVMRDIDCEWFIDPALITNFLQVLCCSPNFQI